jgi:cation diffusion facilitator family transporter
MPVSVKQRIQRIAAWSIVVAIGVMALKFVAWWVTGSVALYSDALESIVNVIAASIAWYAIRVSHAPADAEHPHGHHKAEYLSAVVEGVLIVLAALLIFREAAAALNNPAPIDEPALGLAINGAAAVLNGLWAGLLISMGTRHKSPSLEADGRHIMTDVATSVGVIAGLGLSIVTGWHVLDPMLAILVAINILWQGWRVISSSVQGLMDRAAPLEDHMRIRDIISSNSKGAMEVHDLKTRIAGRATFIEFHMVVDARMTVAESHVICDRIEEALKAEIPSVRVIIHVEPDDEAKLPAGSSAVPFA